MRKIDLSRLVTREALAGLLLALCLFAAAVLHARLPATRSLSIAWTFAVASVLGGMSILGTQLLLTSHPLPTCVRLVIALFGASAATSGILATASAGSTASFATGCIMSLLILGSSAAMALREDKFAVAKLRTDITSAPTVAAPIPAIEPLVASRDQNQDTTADHPPHDLDQSWRRWHEDNQDILEGCVRVAFEPGLATAIVHIPVQPAMAAPPQVECEPVEDCPIRISADPVLPYGIRLVCRRTEAVSEPFETMVSVLISSSTASARAA
jgi:hypothetical protein